MYRKDIACPWSLAAAVEAGKAGDCHPQVRYAFPFAAALARSRSHLESVPVGSRDLFGEQLGFAFAVSVSHP
jgi:hypothetical protein